MILAINLVAGIELVKIALKIHNNHMRNWNRAKAEGRL